MNNLVLQKLIHLYQDPRFIFNRVGTPLHFNHEDFSQVPADILQSYYKSMSVEIQKAAKFYIDGRDERNVLTMEETQKIITAMPVFAPYKVCFVQLDTEETILNVLIHESPENTQDSDEPIYFMTNIVYIKADQMFSHDYAQYAFTFHRGETFVEGMGKKGRIVTAEDYTYWIKGHFEEFIITNPDAEGMYTNPSLEAWTQLTSSVFITLNILLNYPEITESKEVRGRPNTTTGHGKVKKLSHSILSSKPSFEHKTLKLDMYGNNEGEGSNAGGRSSGTAFHTVRKHIRRLPNGRNTFVKAHFRGSKDVGMVSKDYELTQ